MIPSTIETATLEQPIIPLWTNELWHQDIAGIDGVADASDRFGSALAAGDFNGDGKDDLAIGAPGESYESQSTPKSQIGAAHVLNGSSTGLTSNGSQFWHQDIPGVPDTIEQNDQFGRTLSAGDFNGDGKKDLAIGVIGENDLAGAVNVLYGSSSGLTTNGTQFWTQSTNGVLGTSQPGDLFSSALANGDFNGDGKDDLAIGVSHDTVNGKTDAGAVNVLYGSSSGLTTNGNQLWHLDSPSVLGVATTGDQYGSTLAVGDFNGDGKKDLAIGAEFKDVGNLNAAGQVNVLFGSSSGLTANGNYLFSQNNIGVQVLAEAGDRFGSALAAGDFNGDGKDDLAIGAKGKNISGANNAGAVDVVYGSSSGFSSTGNQIFSQNTFGVSDGAAANDNFGAALGVGDFNNDGFADLAIGIPQEEIDGVAYAGAVQVLYGSSNGLTTLGSQFWHQNSTGIADTIEGYEFFGSSLTTGDFNQDGFGDLAIGAFGESIGAANTAGVVHVLFGSSNGLKA